MGYYNGTISVKDPLRILIHDYFQNSEKCLGAAHISHYNVLFTNTILTARAGRDTGPTGAMRSVAQRLTATPRDDVDRLVIRAILNLLPLWEQGTINIPQRPFLPPFDYSSMSFKAE